MQKFQAQFCNDSSGGFCSGRLVRRSRSIFAGLGSLLAVGLLLSCISACGGGGGGGGGGDDEGPRGPLALRSEPLLEGIDFPVGVATTPDGRILFTELRSGLVRVIGETGLFERPFAILPVPPTGADGLLGIAVDTDFSSNHYVYVFGIAPNPARGRVVRFTERGGVGEEPTVILDNLPQGGHNGGKILSARDGTLFVSQGDAGLPNTAQDLSTTAGKILHVTRDGKPVDDSPYENGIYAIGFRNVFGLAEDTENDTIYASENGPDCDDEVDVLVSGGNYGWSQTQECGDENPAFVQPSVRISPSIGVTGLAFYPESGRGELFPELYGTLLLADYNTGSIRRYVLSQGPVGSALSGDTIFGGGNGPITDITVDANGQVLFVAGNGIYRLARLAQ